MATLIVVGFKKDICRASSVLTLRLDFSCDWVIDLYDAVAVYRDYSGKLRVDQNFRLTTSEGDLEWLVRFSEWADGWND